MMEKMSKANSSICAKWPERFMLFMASHKTQAICFVSLHKHSKAIGHPPGVAESGVSENSRDTLDDFKM